MEGEHKSYHDNGNLAAVGFYKDNFQRGEWNYYHKNGQLAKVGTHSDSEYGVEIGEWRYYDTNGNALQSIRK